MQNSHDLSRGSTHFVGRSSEREWLGGLLADAVHGRSSVTVLHGEPGVGKTALIAAVIREMRGLDLIHLAGVEVESAIPFAALQRLVLAHRDVVERLHERQRTALEVATGIAAGDPADPALVGLGVLSLLSELVAELGLLVWVDDPQWLDSESLRAIAFASRRLAADRIAVVFTARGVVSDLPALAGFATRPIEGLDARESLALLNSAARGRLEPTVAQRIIVATAGNPLALVDLAHELSEQQLVGTAPLPDPIPAGAHLEASYLRVLRSLPTTTQEWLLVAAATSDPATAVTREATRLIGIPDVASEAAEIAGLVAVDQTIRFRHPLVRSAIYNGSPTADLRRVHDAHSRSAAARGADDESVLHLALATTGTDEEIAARLEASADRAARRGGFAVRTSLLLRSASLSADPAESRRRTISAVESAIAAGALTQASALLEQLAATELDPVCQARAIVAENWLHQLTGRPGAVAEGSARHTEAAELVRFVDPPLARNLLLTAFESALVAGPSMRDVTAREVALLSLELTDNINARDPRTLALRALAQLIVHGYPAAIRTLRDSVEAILDPATTDDTVLDCYHACVHAAGLLFDDDARSAIAQRAEDIARLRGDISTTEAIVAARCYFDLQCGRAPAALERSRELDVIMTAMQVPEGLMVALTPIAGVWGLLGDTARLRSLSESGLGLCAHLGIGSMSLTWQSALMLADMAEGRYESAWRVGSSLGELDPLHLNIHFFPHLIECAIRTDRREEATRLIATFREIAEVNGSAWANALLARCEGLADPGPGADKQFERAAELSVLVDAPGDAAMVDLHHGEWLRRQRRRNAATTRLRSARARFDALGMVAWSARARAELVVLGEVSDTAPHSSANLTSQEGVIARLAADGATNADIAAQLFLSASTVDYHLRKVFRKLSVSSRRQLRAALGASGEAAGDSA